MSEQAHSRKRRAKLLATSIVTASVLAAALVPSRMLISHQAFSAEAKATDIKAPLSEAVASVKAAPTNSPAIVSRDMSGFESTMTFWLNVERWVAGLPVLQVDDTLTFLARIRAEDMASLEYFSHYRPDGSLHFANLLNFFQVPFRVAGENIARNNYPDSETASVAIQGFMSSPPHRENILSTSYNAIGVGVAEDGSGMKYYAVILIER